MATLKEFDENLNAANDKLYEIQETLQKLGETKEKLKKEFENLAKSKKAAESEINQTKKEASSADSEWKIKHDNLKSKFDGLRDENNETVRRLRAEIEQLKAIGGSKDSEPKFKLLEKENTQLKQQIAQMQEDIQTLETYAPQNEQDQEEELADDYEDYQDLIDLNKELTSQIEESKKHADFVQNMLRTNLAENLALKTKIKELENKIKELQA